MTDPEDLEHRRRRHERLDGTGSPTHNGAELRRRERFDVARRIDRRELKRWTLERLQAMERRIDTLEREARP